MEFFVDTQPTGADIAIGTEVARRLGREVQFVNIGFDAIIPALLAKQCDAIITGWFDTPERAQQIDFVDYLQAGLSLLVPKGNPQGITSLETTCGHAAGALASSAALDTLTTANATCTQAGNPAIQVVSVETEADGLAALKAGRIDVYVSDSEVAAYDLTQDPAAFAVAGPVITPSLVGIGVRKDSSPLREAIQQAVTAMYADGTMQRLLAQWNLRDLALPGTAATPAATPSS
jgi:polar amino acid transport system substrate-binding protein